MLQEQNCLQLDSFNEEDIMYDRIVQSVLEAQGTGQILLCMRCKRVITILSEYHTATTTSIKIATILRKGTLGSLCPVLH